MKIIQVQVGPTARTEFKEIAKVRQTKIRHVARILLEAWKLSPSEVRDKAQLLAMESSDFSPRRSRVTP